jgi:hypothetical protein
MRAGYLLMRAFQPRTGGPGQVRDYRDRICQGMRDTVSLCQLSADDDQIWSQNGLTSGDDDRIFHFIE